MFNISLAPQNFINYQISFPWTVAIKIVVNDILGKNIYQFVSTSTISGTGMNYFKVVMMTWQ
jgi:hypothetical protein